MKRGCRHRLMEDCYTDPFLTHVVLPYLGHHLALLLLGWGVPESHLAPVPSGHSLAMTFMTVTDWLTMGTCVYIISQCPCFTAVNPHELLTLMHSLLSSNHFVYSTRTFCPWNPWLMAQLKVNMEHVHCNQEISVIDSVIIRRFVDSRYY